jgi:hypothetical protein
MTNYDELDEDELDYDLETAQEEIAVEAPAPQLPLPFWTMQRRWALFLAIMIYLTVLTVVGYDPIDRFLFTLLKGGR